MSQSTREYNCVQQYITSRLQMILHAIMQRRRPDGRLHLKISRADWVAAGWQLSPM